MFFFLYLQRTLVSLQVLLLWTVSLIIVANFFFSVLSVKSASSFLTQIRSSDSGRISLCIKLLSRSLSVSEMILSGAVIEFEGAMPAEERWSLQRSKRSANYKDSVNVSPVVNIRRRNRDRIPILMEKPNSNIFPFQMFNLSPTEN